MEVTSFIGSLGETAAQALTMIVFKDEKADAGVLRELDDALGGMLGELLESGEFKGKEGDTAYLFAPKNDKLKAQRVLLLGAGEADGFRAAQVSRAAGTAARYLRAKNIKTIAFVPRSDDDTGMVASAAAEGAIMGLFDTDKYRTIEKDEKSLDSFEVVFTEGDEKVVSNGVERGRIVGEAINYARDMANEPGNRMTPSDMAARAQEVAEKYDLEVEILDEARMEQEGMGSLLSVARGSEEPAKLIILKYMPAADDDNEKDAEKPAELLALVGKGLTFDTGGISIKPAENMELMKYDMAGGAAVIGAMAAIAQLKPSIPVLGVVPSTENMPSGKATKPGDVVRAMNGKTIEVINTDAEGRLILADAMCYAKKLGATCIVDMATLTGAVSIALGDVHAAVIGTDQDLINEIMATGKEVGESFWQLPLDKDYSKQIKSDIADIKNVGGRKAGTITAAAFLKEFAEDMSWAHLDIAGTAWGDDAKPYRPKGATGLPVRMLVRLVERRAAK